MDFHFFPGGTYCPYRSINTINAAKNINKHITVIGAYITEIAPSINNSNITHNNKFFLL
jgi:hypothetical protein